jgi:hypothetical protein
MTVTLTLFFSREKFTHVQIQLKTVARATQRMDLKLEQNDPIKKRKTHTCFAGQENPPSKKGNFCVAVGEKVDPILVRFNSFRHTLDLDDNQYCFLSPIVVGTPSNVNDDELVK